MARFIPYRRTLTRRAQALRREQTPAERKLWYCFLSSRPEKFTRQKPLGSYVADFYCSSRRLIVELDGDSHFVGSAQRYDAARARRLAEQGLRVLRFTNKDVAEAFEAVCMQIEEALQQTS